MDNFLLFNPNLPHPDIGEIIKYTAQILILGNVLFIVTCKILGISESDVIDEKEKRERDWKEAKISPIKLLLGDLVNSTLYSPIAEELTFRYFLMKIILVQKFGIDPVLSNIIQGSLFGLMHMTNSITSSQSVKYSTIQSISAGINGMISGMIYIKSNSIIPSLLAHMIHNGSASFSEFYDYYRNYNEGEKGDENEGEEEKDKKIYGKGNKITREIEKKGGEYTVEKIIKDIAENSV